MRSLYGSENSNWKGGLIQRECPVCKKIFLIKRKDIRPVNCCSRKCLGVMNRERWIVKKEVRLSQSQYFCESCHAKILPTSTDIKLFKIHFCNMDCFSAWKIKNSHGSLNANWKGGVTSLRHFLYNCTQALEWKEKVRTRDNYTCQKCPSRSNLHVHHKRRMALLIEEFLKEYNQFSPIEDKETLIRLAVRWGPFWDIANGETLCIDCHAEEDEHDFLKGTLVHGSA
jgi:uncharacterized C2H2 Zn-finger protein